MKKITQKIKNISQRPLVKDSLWQLLAKAVNILCQAAYFTIIVRVLGAENYGAFVGITAFAALIFPFANLGSADVLIQQVSKNRKAFGFYWGNTLIIVLVASIILTLVAWLSSPFLFPNINNLAAVLVILLADLTGLGILISSGKAFVSCSLFKNSSILQIFGTVTKLLAAILLATLNNPTLLQWSYLYLLSAIVTTTLGIIWIGKTLGKPKIAVKAIPAMINRGIYFAIGESAYNINSDIDKTMLASMSTLEATGIYGAAYRLIQVGSIPIYSALSAAYPRFFQEGVKGVKGCLSLVKSLLPFAAIYGIVFLVGCLVFAPGVVYILGDEYQNAIATLRWLAPIPIIGSIQLLLANTLTGAGFQKTRSAIQVVTAIGNVGLNFWLIPLYSWKGAVWATLSSDTFRVICLAIAVAWFYYRQKEISSS